MKRNQRRLRAIWVCFAGLGLAQFAQSTKGADPPPETAPATVVELEGSVEAESKGAVAWKVARANEPLSFGDYLRTLQSSKATVRSGAHSLLRLDRMSLVEVLPPRNSLARSHLELIHGSLYLLHRDKPSELELDTPIAAAAIEGTDFGLTVDNAQVTTLTMIDGRASLITPLGRVDLASGEQGIAEPGRPPRKTAVINAINTVQWSLYYPGVLDPDELKLESAPGSAQANALRAYRAGDLLGALARWPKGTPSTLKERLFQAALLLASGDIPACEALLKVVPANNSQAIALRYVIAAVTEKEMAPRSGESGPSQLLGLSYYQQSHHDLPAALQSASAAVALSTNFAFGWERVAELEFSFGLVEAAKEALERSLALAPRNAQAHALKGFVLAAQNRMNDAIAEFDVAIALDGGLDNAWLGRGLCRIKVGQAKAGRDDLQTAAALEPIRSLLRSYLGKAFLNAGDIARAHQELTLARKLDPSDPTPWLYAAILDYQTDRATKSVDDLQKAVDLNGNREIYRSKMLLDQDLAVSSTSLAKIYQDVGMNEASVAEASKAVDYDYGNYASHLFLADSLNALRDPTRFNLRYETAWFNELLLANLLAPPGAGTISQNVSQEEYSRLLEADGIGMDLASQYRSDREAQILATQYGADRGTSYSLDLTYQHNDGIPHPYRTNNALSDIEWYSTIKQQLGPNDALTVITKYENYHSGDNFQYNNPTNASSYFHYNEYQTPLAVAAWHHEWGPGMHTLVLAGRLPTEQDFTDQDVGIPVVEKTKAGIEPYFDQSVSNYSLANQFDIYTAEINQLIQTDTHTFIFGGRYQEGDFHTQDLLDGVYDPRSFPMASTNVTSPFRRISAYAYHSWEIIPSLLLTGGISYDELTYPDNFRFAPINSGTTYRDALSPKLALTWSPTPYLTFRGAYSQALGGASLDESFTLEPTELAGFNQAFRSVINESLVGSVAAPRYQVLGAAMDARIQAHTFLTVQGQYLQSDLNEDVGVYYHVSSAPPPPENYAPGAAPEELRYREPSVNLTLNQLLGPYVAAGAGYTYTRSTLGLSDAFILGLAPYPIEEDQLEAQLHKVGCYLQLVHPSGFYARIDAQWYYQINSGYIPGTFDQPLPVSEFAQVNLYVGYRFWRRRGEATFGVLNVAGGDYSLNPLNVYDELPRSRVWMGRLRFNF